MKSATSLKTKRRLPGKAPMRETERMAELERHQTIVFAATDKVGGAQIAAAWFAALADEHRARAVLASSRPVSSIHPAVVAAMKESGHDLKFIYTRVMTPELLLAADLVVTMGDTFERRFLGTDAPIHREHWLIPETGNPDDLNAARALRDLIRSRVAMLVFMEGWGRADISRDAARVTRGRAALQTYANF